MNKDFLEKVSLVAEKNQMVAFLGDARVKTLIADDIDWSEIKLLKIYPRGVRSEALLIVEISEGILKLYSHRNPELTRKHRQREITEQWILDFINHNQSLACEVTARNSPAPLKSASELREYVPLSEETINAKRSERNRVSCSCLGEVENCAHCFGQGYYVTNGFGKKI
jgi:hypothetical protein